MVFSLGPFGSMCKILMSVYVVLNMCSAKFDFISGCVSAFICSVYCVLKDLPVWPM